jgi:hypothetical protein
MGMWPHPTQASGPTPLVVLRTTEGGPLLSSTQPLGTIPGSGPTFLQFAFGFSTDEEILPGIFLDSLTLTLGEVSGPTTTIYGATDRTGTLWAPSAPGTIFLSPDSVVRQSITPPALAPNYAHQSAFLVTAPVPQEFAGRNVNFYTDLFNNANSAQSLGWISSITVVPEPSTILLSAVALGMFVVFRRRHR